MPNEFGRKEVNKKSPALMGLCKMKIIEYYLIRINFFVSL